MNAPHIHLLVNHLPIFATLLALPVAVYGVFSISTPQVLRVTARLLIIAAVATPVAMRSGEDAEEIVEPLEHVEPTQIHTHSEHANNVAPVILGVGVLAILAVVFDRRSSARRRRTWQLVLLIAASVTSAGLLRTGLSGGQINHREIREGFDPSAPVTPEEPLDL